ncbi:MAG: hypothetical protein OXL68_14165 [Paracoccaceae bacterium]|nr:hypothetical protein [Paracoccaceae bacterium]
MQTRFVKSKLVPRMRRACILSRIDPGPASPGSAVAPEWAGSGFPDSRRIPDGRFQSSGSRPARGTGHVGDVRALMHGRSEVIVEGAGIAGLVAALALPGKGCDVTLFDRWEPGHVRASPSDTTRILRMIHGRDELQTEWVRQSRLRRLELQEEMTTIFVP